MRLYLITHSFFFLYLLFFSACQSGEPREEKNYDWIAERDKSDEEKPAEPSDDGFQLPKLSQENVAKELSKFAEENPETLVKLSTRLGDMTIKLYEGTPLHRANFLQLTKRKYYDGTVFHRVIKDFVIQGGNDDDSSVKKKRKSVGNYRIPSEMQAQRYFHKRGALGSPRRDEENPDKLSNPFEFYIVQGTKLEAAQVQSFGAQGNIVYSAEQIQAYTTIGGVPHLDGKYTVFGEVIEGFEVIDKIATLEINPNDQWPHEDVFIKMEVIK